MTEFVLNNTDVKSASPGGTPLLEVIRREQNSKATKLACSEGECGACTVLVGTLTASAVKYQSVTSCISPLINAQGKHLVTLDGLLTATMNPVQRAMVDCNGTQCGFCTPGFIVSMIGMFMSGLPVTKASLITAIDGNICRCTGYKSIERAADQVAEKFHNRAFTLNQLVEMNMLPAYFLAIEDRLKMINNGNAQTNSSYINIGGGTDLYVQKPQQLRNATLQPMATHEHLKGIYVRQNICSIGAAETMTSLQQSEVLQQMIPDIHSYLAPVGSTQIRNMATLGGNLVNASPVGDLTIMLLGLDANIILGEKGHERRLKLRDFYLGYKKLNKTSGEIINRVEFRVPSEGGRYHFERVCKRTYLDVASVNTACFIVYDESQVVSAAHLSAGGVAPIPLYLNATSEFLLGKHLSASTILEASKIMQQEITPISDIRGSAEYKRLLLRQLFFVHMHKLSSAHIPMQDLIYS